MSKAPAKASDPNDLERRILDPNIAKSEAEWWAKSRIEELEHEVAELKAQVEEVTRKYQEHAGNVYTLQDQVKLLRDALITWGDQDTPLGVRIDTMVNALAATEPKP